MWQYYRRFLRTLWGDFKVATGVQVIALLVAIAIFAFQYRFGLIPEKAVHANFWSIAWPYVGLIVGLFVWHLTRTPYKLDQQRATVIENLTTELQEAAKAKQKYLDAAPRLGMRIVPLSDPLVFGSARLDVEFRLRLLMGRPASSLSIEPIYSKRGVHSIHFHSLSFLAGDQESSVEFEVWKLDTSPSRKSRALRQGWGDLLAEFVGESLGNGWGIETSPLIVNFKDGDDYKAQRFRLTFDPNTRQLGVIDEYPGIVALHVRGQPEWIANSN